MKLLALAFLVLAANTHSKHIRNHRLHQLTDDPNASYLANDLHGPSDHHADKPEESDKIDLGLLKSDLIQDIVKEVEEENSKLQAVKDEYNQLSANNANFWKRALVWIDQGKIEKRLQGLGEKLKREISEIYDENTLKKMHLQLFSK